MVLIRTICLTLLIAAFYLWPAVPFAAPMGPSMQPSHHGSACPDCETQAPCPDGMALGCAACPAAIAVYSCAPWLAADTVISTVWTTHPAHAPLAAPDHDPPPPKA